jgi:hypothetical protein
VVLDPAIFAAGPRSVLAALQRRLALIVGRPEVEGADVLEGTVVVSQGHEEQGP